jgi:hypothetical protein
MVARMDERVIDPAKPEMVIAEWQLSRLHWLRIAIEHYKGANYIDIRKWFIGDHDDELHPGKQGITINIKYLPILTDAIVKAHAIAVAKGLVTDNVEYLDRGGR